MSTHLCILRDLDSFFIFEKKISVYDLLFEKKNTVYTINNGNKRIKRLVTKGHVRQIYDLSL